MCVSPLLHFPPRTLRSALPAFEGVELHDLRDWVRPGVETTDTLPDPNSQDLEQPLTILFTSGSSVRSSLLHSVFTLDFPSPSSLSLFLLSSSSPCLGLFSPLRVSYPIVCIPDILPATLLSSYSPQPRAPLLCVCVSLCVCLCFCARLRDGRKASSSPAEAS